MRTGLRPGRTGPAHSTGLREMTSTPHCTAAIEVIQMTETLRTDDNFAESLHCPKTSEIARPAAKSVATVSVDSRYLALLPACLLAASRTCPCQALALSAQG
jgi:hypothetical protein